MFGIGLWDAMRHTQPQSFLWETTVLLRHLTYGAAQNATRIWKTMPLLTGAQFLPGGKREGQREWVEQVNPILTQIARSLGWKILDDHALGVGEVADADASDGTGV